MQLNKDGIRGLVCVETGLEVFGELPNARVRVRLASDIR